MLHLKQLIQQVSTEVKQHGVSSVLDLAPILSQYQSEDWWEYLETENGTPKTTTLYQDDDLRVMLIYWKENERSRKHGHPTAGGLMKVLAGKLWETRFAPMAPELIVSEQEYGAGDLSFIHDALAYHIIENNGPEPAVSLHIYSPGVSASRVVPTRERVLMRA